ncbi:MAG: ATP synthase F0 subunit C [Turicibacter sp.]|nr:ATP synthase F0 subunit C [Turicibacter sp.]
MSIEPLAFVLGLGQIGAGIAILNGIGVGVGQGHIGASAIQAIARQPESRGTVMSTLFVSMAMSETSGIYGLVIAIILLFANPLVGQAVTFFG